MRFCSMHLEISSPLEILVEQLARHQTISWHLDYAIEFTEPSAEIRCSFFSNVYKCSGQPCPRSRSTYMYRNKVGTGDAANGILEMLFWWLYYRSWRPQSVSLLEMASVHMGYSCHWASREFGHIRCYIVLAIHSRSLIVSHSLWIAKSGGSGV